MVVTNDWKTSNLSVEMEEAAAPAAAVVVVVAREGEADRADPVLTVEMGIQDPVRGLIKLKGVPVVVVAFQSLWDHWPRINASTVVPVVMEVQGSKALPVVQAAGRWKFMFEAHWFWMARSRQTAPPVRRLFLFSRRVPREGHPIPAGCMVPTDSLAKRVRTT